MYMNCNAILYYVMLHSIILSYRINVKENVVYFFSSFFFLKCSSQPKRSVETDTAICQLNNSITEVVLVAMATYFQTHMIGCLIRDS